MNFLGKTRTSSALAGAGVLALGALVNREKDNDREFPATPYRPGH